MSLQYRELWPTSGWDRFVSLGHRVSRLGSVTARHSSTGRQRNFASLNRGRHLYLTGQPEPSRWAFAHILVCRSLLVIWREKCRTCLKRSFIIWLELHVAFSALTLSVGRHEGRSAYKKYGGMVEVGTGWSGWSCAQPDGRHVRLC